MEKFVNVSILTSPVNIVIVLLISALGMLALTSLVPQTNFTTQTPTA